LTVGHDFGKFFAGFWLQKPTCTGVDGACDNFLLKFNDEPLPDDPTLSGA
jgi:hypothetical protein